MLAIRTILAKENMPGLEGAFKPLELVLLAGAALAPVALAAASADVVAAAVAATVAAAVAAPAAAVAECADVPAGFAGAWANAQDEMTRTDTAAPARAKCLMLRIVFPLIELVQSRFVGYPRLSALHSARRRNSLSYKSHARSERAENVIKAGRRLLTGGFRVVTRMPTVSILHAY